MNLEESMTSYDILRTSPATYLVLLLVGVAAFYFATNVRDKHSDRRAILASKGVPEIPNRLPLVGHALQFFSNLSGLLERERDANLGGIYSLRLGSTTYNVVCNPNLVDRSILHDELEVQYKPVQWDIMVRFFGMPRFLRSVYEQCWDELDACLSTNLNTEPHLSSVLASSIRELQQNIPNMISFMESVIDQEPWEKNSDCNVLSPKSVEINLYPLIRDFSGSVIASTIFGKAFMETHPDVLQSLHDFDLGGKWLISGLPRWIPLPCVTAAHIARKRTQDAITAFFVAYDSILDGKPEDATWGNMEDVSELMQQRTEIYRRNNMAPRDRGDISILWELTVTTNLFTYWMLTYILSTEGVADTVQEEIRAHVDLAQPESINGFFAAPKLEISSRELSKDCPFFRACFLETLRLCCNTWSFGSVEKDLDLCTNTSGAEMRYRIKAGERVIIPHGLYSRDGRYFKEPERFLPQRFIDIAEGDGAVAVNTHSMSAFGIGPSSLKGGMFIEEQCMATVAGILTTFEIKPSRNTRWSVPARKEGLVGYSPRQHTRVEISRRIQDWQSQDEIGGPAL